MRVVDVPGSLDDRTIDQFAASIGAWPPDDRLLVDARATQFASPAGFTALLTLGQAVAEADGPKPLLHVPTSDNVASYWAKAGLLEHAAEYFELHGKVPKRRRSDGSDVLLAVRPVREQLDVHAIIDGINDKIAQMLTEQLHLEASFIGGFSQALSEVCQNVVEHAGTGGWVAAHTYFFRQRLGRNVAVISVSDAGIGFRRSFEGLHARQLGDRWTDGAAIEAALIHGQSRFRDPGRGQGLMGVKRFISKWNSKVSVRSGTARVAIGPRSWDDEDPRTDDLAWFPGSQLTIMIPAKEGAA